MPVHFFVNDRHLVEKGLRNYWGYNSIGYFAPHQDYAASPHSEREFKTMVKTLHSVGIEVILDVVYNHTAEGNHFGPTRGNTLNMRHPRVLQLIMDSLRYWIEEMHVDGFRFDLAAALARELHEVDRLGAFFDIIHQDPVISQAKLIAEPWDLGEGGYQVGRFPVGWTEWNGRYRDVVRDYWKGEGGLIGELAYRVSGSSDLYEHSGRRPYASVNFITAHDGFTLRDLVSYNDKHNEANLDDNRDGENHNRSWNCGVEGPTDDAGIRALRRRQMRNLLATLFLSQGVPMLLSGDERGHTQHGNNNAYCQDNEITWLNWVPGSDGQELLAFTRELIRLRRNHRVFRRRSFFQNRAIRGDSVRDIVWLEPGGAEMSDEQWRDGFARSLGVFLSGRALNEQNERGQIVIDSDFVVFVNAHHESVEFHLPALPADAQWALRLDTASAVGIVADSARSPPGAAHTLQGRSLMLFEYALPEAEP
jgi:glycogen operon protein